MSKFKVGDKVRVRLDLNRRDKYYNEDKETWDNCVSGMLLLRGKTITIKEIGRTGKYRIYEEGYSWTDEMFSGLASEQPRREFIVIHRDGNVMTAEHRVNREVIKSAKATCAPSDTFDFNTGAKLAFDRLMGRLNPLDAGRTITFSCSGGGTITIPQPEPPKFYTGKVFCSAYKPDATAAYEKLVGRVLSIVDGTTTWNGYAGGYRSFEDFCKRNFSGTWHEVKSDV